MSGITLMLLGNVAVVPVVQGYLNTVGWNDFHSGAIGDNSSVNRSSPVQLGSLNTWSKIGAGTFVSTSIKVDGTMWYWGRGNNGQLGDGQKIKRSSPVQIGSLTTWFRSSSGAYASIATKTDGTLWTFGTSNYGQLGRNNMLNTSSPVQVGSLTDWLQPVGSVRSMYCVKTDGTLWSFGGNADAGELGINSRISQSSPVQIGSLTTWSQVSSQGDSNTAAAVRSDGYLFTWGSNAQGQLGINVSGGSQYRSSPVQVGSNDWASVSMGASHCMAIKTNGTLWGWGNGGNGELGQGANDNTSSPIQIGALTDWKEVSAGKAFTIAVRTNGTMWAMGWGESGRLGQNNITSYNSPVQIGSLTTWLNVVAGSGHSVMLKAIT